MTFSRPLLHEYSVLFDDFLRRVGGLSTPLVLNVTVIHFVAGRILQARPNEVSSGTFASPELALLRPMVTDFSLFVRTG